MREPSGMATRQAPASAANRTATGISVLRAIAATLSLSLLFLPVSPHFFSFTGIAPNSEKKKACTVIRSQGFGSSGAIGVASALAGSEFARRYDARCTWWCMGEVLDEVDRILRVRHDDNDSRALGS